MVFASWILALLLLGEDAARAAPPAGSCPEEARVMLNFAGWKAALKRAETPQRREELLGALKLSLQDADPEGSAAQETRATLMAVDESMARLGGGELPDRVIHVRYSIDGSDDRMIVHLVQVLRPLENRRWCALGAALSRRDQPSRKLLTYQLSFVPLLNARTKAIEAQRTESQLRLNETHREYWVVDGFALRKVFDEKILSMASADGGSGTTTKLSEVKLTGGFPKRIQVREVTKRATCDVAAGAGDTACDDSEPSTTATFTYDGTKYVRRP